MPIPNFPCNIPGVLVASNASRLESAVRRNDLSSGAPLFVKEDDDNFQTFNVSWSFDLVEKQVFDSWFKYVIDGGSKLFTIELTVDGYDSSTGKTTKTHECYMNGTPQVSQNGKRWRIGAVLISIEQEVFDECLGVSLVSIHDGFDYVLLKDAIDDLNGTIQVFEALWQP